MVEDMLGCLTHFALDPNREKLLAARSQTGTSRADYTPPCLLGGCERVDSMINDHGCVIRSFLLFLAHPPILPILDIAVIGLLGRPSKAEQITSRLHARLYFSKIIGDDEMENEGNERR